MTDPHRPDAPPPSGSGSFPLLCAHRGIPATCPENTLPSFGAALGVPEVAEIELDVWLSRDGVPVVCHDPRLERTTDRSGAIEETDWADIRGADAGCRFAVAWAGVRVPRLEQVLELVGSRVALNIHVKAPGPGGRLLTLIGRELSRHGMVKRCYLAGDADVLAAARERCPEVSRCCLAQQESPSRMVAAAVEYGCERVQFSRAVEARHIAAAKAAGLVCNLFYSNEPEDALMYLDRGIDVVLTDRAHALAPLFRR